MTQLPGFLTLYVAAAIMLFIGGAATAQEQYSATDVASLNPLSKLDPITLEAFLQKPLFSASRRASEEATTQHEISESPATASLDIRLLGVLVTPEGSVASIADAEDKKSHSLRQGESYQDWQVVSIDGSMLTLSKNGEVQIFTVFSNPSNRPHQGMELAGGKETSDGETKDGPQILPIPDAVRTTVKAVTSEESIAQDNQAVSQQQALVDFFGPSAKPAK